VKNLLEQMHSVYVTWSYLYFYIT